MQKVWEVLSESNGTVKITITADSIVQAVTISNTPDWLNPVEIDHITSLLGTASTWLYDNREPA